MRKSPANRVPVALVVLVAVGLLGAAACRLHVLDPVGFLDMTKLVRSARLVVTDSGGLQKEAYFLRKNCITLREETEWTELVQQGCNKITGADEEAIVDAFGWAQNKFSHSDMIYGEGDAGGKIVQIIFNFRN